MGLEQDLQTEAERRSLNLEQSRTIEVRKKLKFEIHITEHCNLNCKFCNHFSPLAKEEYLSLEEYKKDLGRLSDLFEGEMQQIKILGGEPLLHPNIIQFLEVTRKLFPKGSIKILTNGILLPQMSDAFWEMCRATQTIVYYTKYPIKLDVDKISRQADKYDVPLEIFNIEDNIKTLIHEPIDLEGKQNAKKNFYDCYRPNYCITLKHGRIYTCHRAAHMHLLNEYFNEHIPIDEKNSIDIYKAETGREILEFLVKPIPMCAYCDRKSITTGHMWEISNREKNEFM